MTSLKFLSWPTFVVALIVAHTPSAARGDDAVLLKPKFDPPAEAYVEYGVEATQKFAGPDGKPSELKSRSLYGFIEKVTAKGDSIVIEATLDRALGFMAFSETMKSLYDTDEPDYEEASPMHRDAFTPIMGMALTIKLDADGVGQSAEGGDAIRKKLRDLGDQNFVGKSLADEDFTDARIMAGFGEPPLVLLPNRAVKVGDTWTKTQHDAYPQVGKVVVRYECKLDGVEKKDGRETARLSFKGTTTNDPNDKPEKGQRHGKIDGEFTGTASFDVAQGRIVEIHHESKTQLEVPPWWTQNPDAKLMKIDSQSTTTYSLASIDDRNKHKAEIAGRVAAAKAKHEAEEAEAMAGPVDPVTPENAEKPWLQWGGPDRNFCSDATGLANRWDKDGPPTLWKRPLGDGFSTILCDGDTLYTMYSVRDKDDPLKGEEIAVALDAKTGKTKWEHKYEAPWTKELQMEFGPGPHSTPILVGDKLFTVGCTAKFFCLDKNTGEVVWSKDLHKEYKAALNGRGFGSSPLAYKGNILLPVSKEKGHAIMAFKQSDGSVAWSAGDFSPSYASLQVIDAFGDEELVAFSGEEVVGIDPVDGQRQWSVKHPTQWSANISTPVWCPEDHHLFISSAYGMGSRGVKLEKDDGKVTAKEVWFSNKMKIQHGDAVRVGDWVYGSSGDFGPTLLMCVNAKTGKLGWRQRGISKATVLYADGKLIVLDEDGKLCLVKADSKKYRLLGKATVGEHIAWTVPTLVGRTLYIRDRKSIMAVDLGAPKKST